MASIMSPFGDFVFSTPFQKFSSPEKILNEAARQQYALGDLCRARSDFKEMVQGGKKITDDIMFDHGSTFGFRRPGSTHNWTNPQVLKEWEVDWRFGIDAMTYTDAEIDLNIPDGVTEEAEFGVWKKIKSKLEKRLYTSMYEGLEEALWATPVASTMEDGSGDTPPIYSIPTFINEETNGLYSGWTTVQNISRVTESRWRPSTAAYSYADYLGTTSPSVALSRAFHKMFLKVSFKAPDLGRRDVFDSTEWNRQHIYTNEEGMLLLSDLMSQGNDQFRTGPQDFSYTGVMFNGVRIKYIPELDTAQLYNDGSNNYVEWNDGSVTNDGPRFYWINSEYLKMVIHKKHYFDRKPEMRDLSQPDTGVIPVNIWCNLVCTSARRQGIVYPNA